MKTGLNGPQQDGRETTVTVQQCSCFVRYNMSSQQHDAHGQKCWKKTDRKGQTILIRDHKHDSND